LQQLHDLLFDRRAIVTARRAISSLCRAGSTRTARRRCASSSAAAAAISGRRRIVTALPSDLLSQILENGLQQLIDRRTTRRTAIPGIPTNARRTIRISALRSATCRRAPFSPLPQQPFQPIQQFLFELLITAACPGCATPACAGASLMCQKIDRSQSKQEIRSLAAVHAADA
jgi:hypothetical protein